MARLFPHSASLSLFACIVILSACSFAARDVAPPTKPQARFTRAFGAPNYTEALVYVANFGSNVVTIYPSEAQNPAPIRTLTAGVVAPRSLWIDESGTLYVSNDFGNNNPYKDTVTEFARGASSPNKVLRGLFFPGPIAVDSSGTVFVEDDAASVIQVYENGSTTPTRRITGFAAAASALTIDKAGNLYSVVSYGEQCESAVLKIPTGASRGKGLGIKVPGCADGIALDSRGNLYLGYFGDNNVSAVNVYRPGDSTPFRRILHGVNAPFQLVLDRDGALYVPNDNSTTITVYPRGSDLPSITISTGIQNPFGVAIAPTAGLGP